MDTVVLELSIFQLLRPFNGQHILLIVVGPDMSTTSGPAASGGKYTKYFEDIICRLTPTRILII